jgi:gluconate 2-dehydrogenase
MVQLAVDNLVAALGFGPRAGNPPTPVTARKTSIAITGITGAGKTATGKR